MWKSLLPGAGRQYCGCWKKPSDIAKSTGKWDVGQDPTLMVQGFRLFQKHPELGWLGLYEFHLHCQIPHTTSIFQNPGAAFGSSFSSLKRKNLLGQRKEAQQTSVVNIPEGNKIPIRKPPTLTLPVLTPGKG
ncbi:hypothetical protein AV530_007297 [Patagioenas fasciata monilis]|uniref:Uncharacterized protein n=1 Tax=Patagioenas fasciata monilis TaxID=372326 RepID=A0A1V4JXE4_PATFA|nr:hypothetical protein AV530_007297 [Patagioenas fasciata monilis]